MTEEVKKSGGQPGNQNARKHGFYSNVLSESQRDDMLLAIEAEGIDEEIALLRVKIKSLVATAPENVPLLARSIESLSRLLASKMNIDKKDKPRLADAVTNVLKDIALPMAVNLANIMKKG